MVDNRIGLVQNIFNSYIWTLLWKNISISIIDNVYLFSVTPSVACDFVNFKLKYQIDCE